MSEDMTNPADNPEAYTCPACNNAGRGAIKYSDLIDHFKCRSCGSCNELADWKKPAQKEPDQYGRSDALDALPLHKELNKLMRDELKQEEPEQPEPESHKKEWKTAVNTLLLDLMDLHAEEMGPEKVMRHSVGIMEIDNRVLRTEGEMGFSKPAVEPERGQIWLWKDQEDRTKEVLILGFTDNIIGQYAHCWCEFTNDVYVLRVDWFYEFTGRTVDLSALEQSDE